MFLRGSFFGLALIPPVLALAAGERPARAETAHTEVTARADVQVQVSIGRPPPFDGWCVKPACTEASLAAALVKPPPILVPSADYGFLEEKLRRASASALESASQAVVAGRSLPAPVLDLALTAAAAVLGDHATLDRLGGLGASALRAALAYELDRVVPADAACSGVDRIDALYEGLATAASLVPLRFPLQKGTVSAGCVETAKRVTVAVDGAVLRTFVTEDMYLQADRLLATVSLVQKACGDAPLQSQRLADRWKAAAAAAGATRIDAMASSLRQLRGSLPPAPDAASAPVVDGGAEVPLDPASQACADALVAIEAADPAVLAAWMERGLGSVQLESLVAVFHAPVLACDAPAACARVEGVLALLVRFAAGQATEADLRGAVEALAGVLLEGAGLPSASPILADTVRTLGRAVVLRDGTPTIDPTVVVSFLSDKYAVNGDGLPVVRALVGPTPWVFEVNGGIPNVDFAQGKVVADLSFGYRTKTLGLVGRGAVDEYDASTATLHADYAHYHAGLEGFWLAGAPTGLQFELRVTGSFDDYDTTTFPKMPLAGMGTGFVDFDSRMVRGELLAGVRYGGPATPVALEARVGAGVQYEDPDTTAFSGFNLLFKSEANFSAHGSAHALVRWRAVPHILGFRLRGDGDYFSISRSDLNLVQTTTAGTVTVTSEERSQLEVHGRLFTDFDVASLANFVPAAWGGLDVLSDSGGASNNTIIALVVGLGISLRLW